MCIRAVLRTRFSHRQVVLGAGAVTVCGIGDLCQLLLFHGTGGPFLSVADVAYLAFYPLMLGALVVMMWKLKDLAWPLLLDSIVSAIAVRVDGTAGADTTFHHRYGKVPDSLGPVLSTVSALGVLIMGIHHGVPVLAEVLAVSTLALAAASCDPGTSSYAWAGTSSQSSWTAFPSPKPP